VSVAWSEIDVGRIQLGSSLFQSGLGASRTGNTATNSCPGRHDHYRVAEEVKIRRGSGQLHRLNPLKRRRRQKMGKYAEFETRTQPGIQRQPSCVCGESDRNVSTESARVAPRCGRLGLEHLRNLCGPYEGRAGWFFS